MCKRVTFILGTLFHLLHVQSIICDRNVCLLSLFFSFSFTFTMLRYTFISPLRYFYIEKRDGVPSDMCDTISDLNLLLRECICKSEYVHERMINECKFSQNYCNFFSKMSIFQQMQIVC